MTGLVAEKILNFYNQLLKEKIQLPEGVGLLNPFHYEEVKEIVRNFYTKYYSDTNNRILLLGINPGRFGAGITGIPFTDPVALEVFCGIKNSFPKKRETSSVFIYDMIEQCGGVVNFYSKFFVGAVSPLGFIYQNKNVNYYEQGIYPYVEDFIVKYLKIQLEISGIDRVVFSLGQGKNLKFLTAINKKYKFFKQIIALPHPRYIMQYRYKSRKEMISVYCNTLLKEFKN